MIGCHWNSSRSLKKKIQSTLLQEIEREDGVKVTNFEGYATCAPPSMRNSMLNLGTKRKSENLRKALEGRIVHVTT